MESINCSKRTVTNRINKINKIMNGDGNVPEEIIDLVAKLSIMRKVKLNSDTVKIEGTYEDAVKLLENPSEIAEEFHLVESTLFDRKLLTLTERYKKYDEIKKFESFKKNKIGQKIHLIGFIVKSDIISEWYIEEVIDDILSLILGAENYIIEISDSELKITFELNEGMGIRELYILF